MYTLYFVENADTMVEVERCLLGMKTILDFVRDDMATRMPNFISFYTRVNGIEGDDEIIIDFGSHSKFYLAVKEDEVCQRQPVG